AALRAVSAARVGMAHLDEQRLRRGLPALPFGAALHLGEILWGNIGAADRLDFTAIGPAVNFGQPAGGAVQTTVQDGPCVRRACPGAGAAAVRVWTPCAPRYPFAMGGLPPAGELSRLLRPIGQISIPTLRRSGARWGSVSRPSFFFGPAFAAAPRAPR